MPKKWAMVGPTAEKPGHWAQVSVTPELKPGQVPEPPPNFTPEEEGNTADEGHPPILTYAQGVEQAQEKKED